MNLDSITFDRNPFDNYSYSRIVPNKYDISIHVIDSPATWLKPYYRATWEIEIKLRIKEPYKFGFGNYHPVEKRIRLIVQIFKSESNIKSNIIIYQYDGEYGEVKYTNAYYLENTPKEYDFIMKYLRAKLVSLFI